MGMAYLAPVNEINWIQSTSRFSHSWWSSEAVGTMHGVTAGIIKSFSAQGYAIIAINFHGSDSYGQNFTDSITGHYGTLPFEDLKLGLTAALNRFIRYRW